MENCINPRFIMLLFVVVAGVTGKLCVCPVAVGILCSCDFS